MERYDVYVVTEASADASPEAHDMAMRRLVAVGFQPITRLGVAGELQRDWARMKNPGEVPQILFGHAGAFGPILARELTKEKRG